MKEDTTIKDGDSLILLDSSQEPETQSEGMDNQGLGKSDSGECVEPPFEVQESGTLNWEKDIDHAPTDINKSEECLVQSLEAQESDSAGVHTPPHTAQQPADSAGVHTPPLTAQKNDSEEYVAIGLSLETQTPETIVSGD